MFPRHPASLLALVAVGCAEVHAQPRRDAGAARRPAPGVRPNIGLVRDAPLRGPLTLRDAGIPPAFLRASTDDAADIRAQFDALDIAAATTQPAPLPVIGEGIGTLSPPRADGRFEDPENLAGVPLPEVRSWLAVAAGWTLRCLERAPDVDPFTLPVRFTVGRDGSVTGVTAEGAADGVQRCLTEGFSHARFRPKAQPVELVARYRYTVRWRPRAVRDAGVADGGRAR